MWPAVMKKMKFSLGLHPAWSYQKGFRRGHVESCVPLRTRPKSSSSTLSLKSSILRCQVPGAQNLHPENSTALTLQPPTLTPHYSVWAQHPTPLSRNSQHPGLSTTLRISARSPAIPNPPRIIFRPNFSKASQQWNLGGYLGGLDALDANCCTCMMNSAVNLPPPSLLGGSLEVH